MQSSSKSRLDDGLQAGQREAIRHVLRDFSQVTAARLYGSRAMGRYRSGSDIDLTLMGDIDLKTLNRISLALDDLMLPYEIDLSVWSQIDNPKLRDHIERVGILFYSREK